MPRMEGVRLLYKSNEAPSSATDVVGSVLILCVRALMSVGRRVGRGRLVYPAFTCCVCVGVVGGVMISGVGTLLVCGCVICMER